MSYLIIAVLQLCQTIGHAVFQSGADDELNVEGTEDRNLTVIGLARATNLR